MSSLIDVWCTLEHYRAHLEPIWQAIPRERRGAWFDITDDPVGGGVLIVAAYRDLHWMRHRYRRLVLVEHGIGQQYVTSPGHPGYPGGDREPYDLLLAPGPHVDDRAARETVHIGCPKLLPWIGRGGRGDHGERVAVSFHWDCNVAPEASTSFWHFLPHLAEQAELAGGLLVHAHPRIAFEVFEQVAGFEHVEIAPTFDQVLDEAGVYCCDNSSTLYEFAAVGRPVVFLNAPQYRRHVEHGKRFWSWSDIGPHVDDPTMLASVALQAIRNDWWADSRAELVETIYGPLTAERTLPAVDALLRLAE